MKAAELRELTRAELAEKLEGMRKELFNLRFRLATGELDNVMRVRHVRKNIARVLTVIRQKELAGEPVDAIAAGPRRRGKAASRQTKS